jgi:tetratricopeptide (TPR) repeat protein
MAEPTDPAFPWSQQIINNASNFGSQGIFVTQVPPPPPPMLLDQALALLADLPLDDIPESQTLPQPHRMPFAHNPLFVGRTEKLREIAEQLKAGGTIAVTTGIGGVGKTQLAIEAAHRYGRYFGGGVFWLSFADPGAIASEVADCGRRIGAFHEAEKLDLNAQVERTFAGWDTDLPRLLIFDNCEDEVLLREWRPKTGQCRVLVTSRKQASWSADLGVRLLPLEVLVRAESVRLLQKLAPHLSSEEAGQVAEELGDLPLALHLAGCYLQRYQVTVESYLARLRSLELLTHASLIGRGIEGMPTDRQPHVARAFALSFERLDACDPIDDLARQFLARAACFAPGEPFGRNWLEATITREGDEEEQQHTRTDAVERLLGLGLLEPVAEKALRLHRLLVAYTEATLRDVEALPAVEQIVDMLAIQANKTKVPQAMRLVLPHLRHLVQQAAGREDEMVARLHNNLDYYLGMTGAYQEALFHSKQALMIRERVLGADHPQIVISLNNLVELYRVQGDYETARSLCEQALVICERVLGTDHTLTATSLNNLAELYRVLGNYEAALPLCERALAVMERVLGSDHPDTATCLNNLAELYRAQGAYEVARSLYERALMITERVLGINHPDTASSLNNLALLLKAQGSNEMAWQLHERALVICEQALGAEHPNTAACLNNLALLLEEQGAYGEAWPLYKRALEIREQALGFDHPDTAQSLNNLAGLLKAQGAYGAALPLYERALAICERVLGTEHPDTAICLNNLAILYASQGQFCLALPLLERGVAIWQAHLGSQHPTTLQAQWGLVAMRQAAVIADLPEPVRASFQARDSATFQQTLQVLPPEEAQAVVARLRAAGILSDPLSQFSSLLQAIATVAQGNDAPRAEIEAALAQLEQDGYHLTTPVRAIWDGQRDPAALTDGLDDTDTALVQRILALLEAGAGS